MSGKTAKLKNGIITCSKCNRDLYTEHYYVSRTNKNHYLCFDCWYKKNVTKKEKTINIWFFLIMLILGALTGYFLLDLLTFNS